jgi:hypothetical protein
LLLSLLEDIWGLSFEQELNRMPRNKSRELPSNNFFKVKKADGGGAKWCFHDFSF